MVLPLKWRHLKHVTPQFSLHERNICSSCNGIGTWAVVEAWHLRYVGIELLYTTYKLMHADMLGLLEHVGEVKLLLLSRVDGKHGEKEEHDATFK
jgi:hypothetical protein